MARMLPKSREIGERGIRGQHQDGECRVLQREVHGASTEDAVADLREHGLAVAGEDVQVLGEEADPEEEDAEDGGHPGERHGGVAGDGVLKAPTPLEIASVPVMATHRRQTRAAGDR